MTLFVLFLTALVASCGTFFSGYILLRAMTRRASDDCWLMGGTVGCCLLATIALLIFCSRAFNSKVYFVAIFIQMLVCFMIARVKYHEKAIQTPPQVFRLIACFWMVFFLGQCLVPVYTNAYMYGDWWMHYDISQFYLGLRTKDVLYFNMYTIPSRTPWFNLYASFIQAIIGTDFANYQMIALVPGISLISAAQLFVANEKRWILATLLAFNPFIFTMILFPWPKTLAAACVIVAAYEVWRLHAMDKLLTTRMVLPVGIWVGLGVLAHPSTLFYSVGIMFYMYLSSAPKMKCFGKLVMIGLAASLVTFPWFIWIVSEYGFRSVISASPASEGINSTSWLMWMWQRVVILIATMVPLPMALALWSGKAIYIFNAWLRFYYSVLPGAITFTISYVLLFLIGFNKHLLILTPWKMFFTLSVCGLVCGVLLQPGSSMIGVVNESMLPIIVMVLILVASAYKESRLKFSGIFLFYFAEFVISRGLHFFVNLVYPDFGSDPNMALKRDHSLFFASDVIDGYSSYVCLGIVVILAWLFVILYRRLLIGEHSFNAI